MFNKARKYAAEGPMETCSTNDSDMNSIRAPALTTRNRRALGDITNNIATNESSVALAKEAAKKTTSVFSAVTTSSEVRGSDEGLLTSNAISSSPTHDSNSERIYMRREADNIDARDAGNPLFCSCVVNEMYEWFGKVEKDIIKNPSYMVTSQPS